MRNSTLVKSLCAEDVTGLSNIPKLWINIYLLMVEERNVSLRRCTVRYVGGIISEDAGMSSVENG